MNDNSTTVAELRTRVCEFRDARDWAQFHSPKNLSMSIAIEAAELMEEFQWITSDESKAIVEDPTKLGHVEEEIADVLIYCLSLSDSLGVDIANVVEKKIGKNAQKYPQEKFKGRF